MGNKPQSSNNWPKCTNLFLSHNCWTHNLIDICSLAKPNISTYVSKLKSKLPKCKRRSIYNLAKPTISTSISKCKRRKTNYIKSSNMTNYTTIYKKSWKHSLTTTQQIIQYCMQVVVLVNFNTMRTHA